MWNNEGISMNNIPFSNSSLNSPASGRTLRNQGFNVENEEKSRLWNCLRSKPTGQSKTQFHIEYNRLVPDMTLTLKKTTLTLKMGGSVHLPQRGQEGHVLLWLCY